MSATGSHQPRRLSTGAAAGFTLLELLVVLAIIALVVTLTPLMTRNVLANARAKAAAETLAADMKWSRNRAISTGRETSIIFDLADGRYTRSADGVSRELPRGVRLAETVGANSGPTIIRFFPDGTSNGGRFDIAQGTRTYEVSVVWPFGRVRYAE